MITLAVDDFNPLTQDFYDRIIAGLQFHQLACTCGRSGCLTVHGYYSRSVKSGISSVRLRICRVKCSCCKATHALLLSSIVPYSQVSLTDQKDIIAAFEEKESPLPVMEHTPSIDEGSIRSIIRQYLRFFRQRLLAEKIPLSPLPSLVRSCFACFGRQFMQIKPTRNILFLTPT